MQAGYGYPQQLVPGMRPGGAPVQSFLVPMVQQGQQGHRPGGRRGAGPMQQLQQPVPLMHQQVCCCINSVVSVLFPPLGFALYACCWDTFCCVFQMLPRGRVYRYPPGRNMQGFPQPGVPGEMPIQALATALANAPPQQQRTVRPFSGYYFNTFRLSTLLFHVH